MEELFFAGLIGSVQIDSIIPYILRMEPTQYNVQFTTATSSTWDRYMRSVREIGTWDWYVRLVHERERERGCRLTYHMRITLPYPYSLFYLRNCQTLSLCSYFTSQRYRTNLDIYIMLAASWSRPTAFTRIWCLLIRIREQTSSLIHQSHYLPVTLCYNHAMVFILRT